MNALFRVLAAAALALLFAGCRPAEAVSLVGSKTDAVVLRPLLSAPACPTGLGCVYALASDGQMYDVDAAGAALRTHAAKSFRSAVSCAALASPADGDVCFDSTLTAFRFYAGGWQTAGINDSLVVHKAGTETITGAKTFTASVALSGGASLGANLAGGGFKGTGFAQGSATGELLTAGRAVQTSAPLTGGGALTADLTLGLSVSAPLQVAGGSLGVSAGALVYAAVTGGAAGALSAGTLYLTAPGLVGAVAEHALGVAPRAGVLRNLVCDLGTAPGGADTVTVTARANGADTGLTCTITGAATQCPVSGSTAAVAASDRVSVKAVTSGGAAADLTCTLEHTN